MPLRFGSPNPTPQIPRGIVCSVLYCFVKCETVGCSQSVQRFAAGSLPMRSYSAMERQSAAATGVKKETPDSHGFVPGDAW